MSAQLQPVFSWSRPNSAAVFAQRIRALQRLRANPVALPVLREFYRINPARFIDDWGCIAEPRADQGASTVLPFTLWPRQVEFINWVVERWKRGESGLVEKSRDVGCTWLSIAVACTLCLFHRGLVIGLASRKLELVDALGAPKALFTKIRFFLSHLPVEFLSGWTADCAPYCRCLFPGTGSAITGEGGVGIGRGDRTSLHIIDESAFLENSEATDAALSQTTRCRIDVSTPNGLGNSFARRRHGGKFPVFIFDWRDHPGRDDAWLAEQQRTLDPVIVSREILRDYLGSVENQLLPSPWLHAAVDAHRKLGIEITGQRFAALDVADTGSDLNSFCGRHGILVRDLQSWSGANSDLFVTTARAITTADELGYSSLNFDAIGIGSACRGDAEQINALRAAEGKRTVRVVPYLGSSSPTEGRRLLKDRDNKDAFLNLKAQCWWALRLRFQRTYDALQGRPWVADELISLDGSLPELQQLLGELSQAQFSLTTTGKIVIDKAPDGAASPNRADALVICFGAPDSAGTWLFLGLPHAEQERLRAGRGPP